DYRLITGPDTGQVLMQAEGQVCWVIQAQRDWILVTIQIVSVAPPGAAVSSAASRLRSVSRLRVRRCLIFAFLFMASIPFRARGRGCTTVTPNPGAVSRCESTPGKGTRGRFG